MNGWADLEFLKKLINQHYEILIIIKKRENESEFSRISVQEIAEILNISRTQTTSYLKRLIDREYVSKIGAAQYKVLRLEIPELPLYKHIAMVFKDSMINRYNGSLKEQAERIGISLNELRTAQGYIDYFNFLSSNVDN